MSRIPAHTVANAPAASRAILEKIVQSTPGGRPANLHAQMAHSPAVLTAYSSLRAALSEQKSFDPKLGAALTLAVSSAVESAYMTRIASRLALMNGWTEAQVTTLAKGAPTGEAKLDALTNLVREAATHSGNLADPTWDTAVKAGWSDENLADAYAYVGATVFTASFLNYARTTLDL
jgi:hypothetical protein